MRQGVSSLSSSSWSLSLLPSSWSFWLSLPASAPRSTHASSPTSPPLPASAATIAGHIARARLVRLLQHADSGELGAAIAYRGHAASLSNPAERRHVERIRAEELDHRQRVGCLLASLGGRPDRAVELRNWCIGTAIAAFCHVGGWYLPMYGAGWIERRNVAEYEHAAWLARVSGALEHVGVLDNVAELLSIADVEREHERYFRLKAASHPMARLLPVWRAPAPRPPELIGAESPRTSACSAAA